MTRTLSIAPLLALGLAAAPALAGPQASAAAPPEASIPFANHDGIWDWREGDRQTIYIQDRSRRWYKATLMRPSYDLRGTTAVAFETGPTDRFDKFSWVVIRGQRYAVESLVRVAGPPHARKHR
jgi:hypothetical protein